MLCQEVISELAAIYGQIIQLMARFARVTSVMALPPRVLHRLYQDGPADLDGFGAGFLLYGVSAVVARAALDGVDLGAGHQFQHLAGLWSDVLHALVARHVPGDLAEALLELGQDYMRAGLFDRAENLFRELKETKLHVRPALKHLLVIYEKERDWQSCLETADQLESLSGEKLALQKSHYHCELALEAEAQGRGSDAAARLKKAIAAYRDCVRASHLQARLAADQGDYRAAVRILRETAERDADYLPEVLPEIVSGYRQIGDTDGLRAFLDDSVAAHPGGPAVIAMADLLKEQEGEQAAADFLAAQLSRAPSLGLLLSSIDLNTRLQESQSERFLETLRPYIHRLVEERPVYQCGHCGFEAKTLHWQCPSCRSCSAVTTPPSLSA